GIRAATGISPWWASSGCGGRHSNPRSGGGSAPGSRTRVDDRRGGFRVAMAAGGRAGVPRVPWRGGSRAMGTVIGLECPRCGATYAAGPLFDGCPACRRAGLGVNLWPRYDEAAVARLLTRAGLAGRPWDMWRY